MKRFAAFILAAVLVMTLGAVGVFAFTSDGTVGLGPDILNEDGDTLDYAEFDISDSYVYGEAVPPGKRFYVELAGPATLEGGTEIDLEDLTDKDYFNFRLDKDKNGSLLSSVKLVTKRLGGGSRNHYIEVKLKDSRITEEKQLSFDAYFKARSTKDDPDNQRVWNSGDIISVRFELWIENPEEETDASIETGEGVVFNPTSNEDNLIAWGYDEDIACLEFEADSDADKFYAKLSTKNIRSIYEDYGDPADADLYFRDFVGNPAIDSTSRAKLTLYNPYSDYYDYDYRYDVNPRDCFIYLVDKDGYLEDVTDRFTYVHEDETDAGIDGWQTRTRTLGTYVISDVELDLWEDYEGEPQDPENLPPEQQTPSDMAPPPPKPQNPPPSTGASDFVGAALAALALSMGVYAFTRTRK
ncbi:hypothetical protein [Anaerotruncus rubiinfantis]|uniref:hypothetical protein n=1 Tax=Anaerotruncus rubiinfantis TaxID=1720200 RepID=UPI0034A2D302